MLSLVVAFLAATPAWHEPIPEPRRRPLGAWLSAVIIGVVALTMSMPPIAIALGAYQAEATFRAQCVAAGGHVALMQRARHPHACIRE